MDSPPPAAPRRNKPTQAPTPSRRAIPATGPLFEANSRPELKPWSWSRFFTLLGGTSFLISLFLHIVGLGLLSIPVMKIIAREKELSTVLVNVGGDGGGDGVEIGQPIGIDLSPPSSQSSSDSFHDIPLLDSSAMSLPLPPDSLSSGIMKSAGASGGASGEGGEGGTSGALGTGFRLEEPANSVKAGSFSVWSWPIIDPIVNKISNKSLKHGVPGSNPKTRQNYHVVIRMKVPADKKVVRVSDFSGTIEGSDRYKQKIPRDAYVYNDKGELKRATPGNVIPIVEGTVELLILVPGADKAIRDEIIVKSHVTGEEQKIVLEFGADEDQMIDSVDLKSGSSL
ncbi:hypothetical protein SH668x_003379 [Planctomicrobium sp. SH668]|uniref:hypothetical protein n=1 Tax=Planctomicrobium sp. SH668 TaxID=3448126 RepID=UPI003F5B70B4